MLKEVKWSNTLSYSSETDEDPIEFYLNALTNSNSFDLLLGYFSSAAINVLSLGFASFINRGGKMRIVANNILSLEDKLAIERGTLGEVDPNLIDIGDISKLKDKLDDYSRHFFECIALFRQFHIWTLFGSVQKKALGDVISKLNNHLQ